MKSFLTDSLAIKKEYKDFIFVSDFFKWKIEFDSSGINLKKEEIKKIDIYKNPPIAIISPSNYKLIYDLLSVNKETTFYKPENFNFGKRKKYIPSEKKISTLFENYLKRSYLSYLNYEGLKNIGIRRIEQYIILMSLIPFQNDLVYDNLKIKNDTKIIKKIDEKKYNSSLDKLNLINFIYAVGKETSFSFDYILSYMLKLYSELKISDPFDSTGFNFLTNDDSLIYQIYKDIIDSRLEIKEENWACFDEVLKKQIIIKTKTTKEKNKRILNYFSLQNEDYFEDKYLHSKITYPNILMLNNFLSDIIPFRDLLLSLKLLIKMRKITNNDLFLELKKEDILLLNPKDNIEWISSKTWKTIYENQDYAFASIVNPIYTKAKGFTCPLCGSLQYRINPTKLYCAEKGCNFFVNRINLKSLGVPRISVENIIEGLNSKSIMIKKKDTGYLNVFLNQDKDYFYFFI